MTSFSLDKLLAPRSIAVVGASTRPGAAGSIVVENLLRLEFEGSVYPVNPRYEEIAGLPCYPSLSAIPDVPDAVFIGIPAAAAPGVLQEAGEKGIKGAEINASGFGDDGPEGQALQAELARIAGRYGIALCGPNNMGYINLRNRCAIYTSRVREVRPGPVALVGQSGSACLAMGADPKQLGLSYLITAGNEAVVTAADYLDYLVRDDAVRLVLMFLETIRQPEKFAAAAIQAAERGKRIIAIKVGRSQSGEVAVRAHTGAIAGQDDVYEAFFKRYGIIRVADFDEMAETAALFASYPDPPENVNVVPITMSGGEAALVADLAEEAGVTMRPFAGATVERLRRSLAPFSSPRNPLDAWGLGWDVERFEEITETLLADDDVGIIAPAMDAPAGRADAEQAVQMTELFQRLMPETSKRFIMIQNSSASGTDQRVVDRCAQAGIPCLDGLREALLAIGHWTNYRAPAANTETYEEDVAEMWRQRAALPQTEAENYRLLTDVGIAMVQSVAVTTPDVAAREAERIGYPVALKGVVPGVAHKTELGLVRLNLENAEAVRRAFDDISERADELRLEPMVGSGLELIIGVRNDPSFGTVVVAGPGGVHVETMRDVSVRLGPVDRATALEMLGETRAGELLAGVRGKGPFDAEAAADAIVALSRFGAATGGILASAEINPLIVLERGRGAVGVDVLLEWVDEPVGIQAKATISA